MPMLDDAIAWFVGRTLGRIAIGDHMHYVLEPVATWAPECSDDPLYMSDVDDIFDDDDGGHPDPQRVNLWGKGVVQRPAADVARKYGLRFTIDGL